MSCQSHRVKAQSILYGFRFTKESCAFAYPLLTISIWFTLFFILPLKINPISTKWKTLLLYFFKRFMVWLPYILILVFVRFKTWFSSKSCCPHVIIDLTFANFIFLFFPTFQLFIIDNSKFVDFIIYDICYLSTDFCYLEH